VAEPNDRWAIPPAAFRWQMEWLARRGYRGVSLSQALQTDAGSRIVALTFDDGYRGFAEQVWPVLQALNFGCTLLVVTGRVGRPADWPEALGKQLLDWDALQALAVQGVELGAHGHSHRPLDNLPLAEVEQELQTTRKTLADRLGTPPAGLVYPYGRWSPAVERSVQATDFQWAATARGGRNQSSPSFQLRRTLITAADSQRWCFVPKCLTGYASLVEWRMDLRGVQ